MQHDLPPPIFSEVEAYLRATGMAASKFGEGAVNDPNLIRDIKAGREPRRKTVARVREYMAANPPTAEGDAA